MAGDYRVRRPKEHDDFMQLLKNDGVFASLKQVLVFAASYGFKSKHRRELKETAEPIPGRIFDENTDKPFMLAMALSETNDIGLLRSDRFEEVLAIFEEYAAGGLDLLKEEVSTVSPKSSIENILINNSSEKDILDEIIGDW